MLSEETIVAQTKKWIQDVVVGCNFCPFANREIIKESILYKVVPFPEKKLVLEELAKVFDQLSLNDDIETALLILPTGFASFTIYLRLVDIAESLLAEENLEGIFQLASFHPAYLFAGSVNTDPSNYTNRSPYPMLHVLREASITKAVESFPGVELVPDKNIAFAEIHGLEYLQNLRQASLDAFK